MNVETIVSLFANSSAGEEDAKSYLEKEGLLSCLDEISSTQTNRIKPKYCDLARLHYLSRQRKVFVAMEFGVGFSTLVVADAIYKNEKDWAKHCTSQDIEKEQFCLYSVDGGTQWIEQTKSFIPEYLKQYIKFHVSTVSVTQFLGRLCHTYDNLPDIVPDFIYVDGPDPITVDGELNGQSWKTSDRPVMSADVLQLESTLLPGTLVVVDGRTLNSRFIAANVFRNWDISNNVGTDVTAMEIRELPLGRRNELRLVYQLGETVLGWPNPLTDNCTC